MSAAAKVLDRLERVKPTGPGRWIAACPAHEDRSPSLSVRELDDGRILLHDFGGCETGDVLAALGLQLSDLFEKPLGHGLPPSHSRIPAADILQALHHEILVALVILNDVVTGRHVNEEQMRRLGQAAARIGAARTMASPARLPHA